MAYPKSSSKGKSKDQGNETQVLKDQLKTGDLQKVYLFSGEERFLLDFYLKEIRRQIVGDDLQSLNLILFEGKTSGNQVVDACDTFPVFADKKLVIVKNSNLLAPRKKSAQEALEEDDQEESGEGSSPDDDSESSKGSKDQDIVKAYLSELPDSTCLLFLEENIDKRTGLYKAIQKYGLHVHFSHLDANELVRWVMKGFQTNQKSISTEAAEYLVSISEPDMYYLKNEILKIDQYTGDRRQVGMEDVRAVATVTIKSVIFDLMDAVSNKDKAKAFGYLDDMLEIKEPEQKILSMISKQTGELLKMKRYLSLRLPATDVAKYFPKKHPFVLRKLTEQASRLDAQYLQSLLTACMEADSSYKKGRISPRLALEVLFSRI